MGLLGGDLGGAVDGGGGHVQLFGLEGAQFAGLRVFPAFGHCQAPIEGCECGDKGETDLKTPDAVEFAVMACFQGGAEAAEDDESDDGAGECSLYRSD